MSVIVCECQPCAELVTFHLCMPPPHTLQPFPNAIYTFQRDSVSSEVDRGMSERVRIQM